MRRPRTLALHRGSGALGLSDARRGRTRPRTRGRGADCAHGRLAYFESYGRRDPAGGAPMAKDSIFRIYSMTKPIVSVAAMMLLEEGRFLLSDPIEKYLPELGNRKVAVTRGSEIDLVDADRSITIQDLLRHTSGITYEFRGSGPVHRQYMADKNLQPQPKATPTKSSPWANCR